MPSSKSDFDCILITKASASTVASPFELRIRPIFINAEFLILVNEQTMRKRILC